MAEMEEERKTHGFSVCERRAADEDGISIQGHGLHVDKFDSETGDMTVSGMLDAVVYYDVKHKRSGWRSQKRGQ